MDGDDTSQLQFDLHTECRLRAHETTMPTHYYQPSLFHITWMDIQSGTDVIEPLCQQWKRTQIRELEGKTIGSVSYSVSSHILKKSN